MLNSSTMDARSTAYAATLLRLVSGGFFIAHALIKIFVFTIPGTVGFFEKLGYPGVLAYVVIAAELVGGLMMVAGLFTRYVAIALVPVMLGALSVHAGNGLLFSNPNGGWEFPVFWTIVLGVQALLGDGALALGRNMPSLLPNGQPAH